MGAYSDTENWLENIYPIKIKETKKISAGLLLNNKYLLKATELSAERLVFIQTAVRHLHKNGFSNAEIFEETLEGLPFYQTEDKNYILTKYFSCPGFSFDQQDDLEVATKLLAQMHIAGVGFTREYATEEMKKLAIPFTVKCTLGDTLHIFRKRCNELKNFKKQASGSVATFDRAYFQIAGEYCALAEELTEQLEASAYGKMTAAALTNGCICHRDFTGHNIVKTSPPLVINFDDVAIELPVYDIANLLKRRLRKCGWAPEEAHFMLDTYDKINPLSREDIDVIKILLQFPQKLWRIVNKYYNSKRSRYEKTALAKLDEILWEREPLSNVIKEL